MSKLGTNIFLISTTSNYFSSLQKSAFLKLSILFFCSVADIADMVADIVATDTVLSICSGLTCLYSVRQITIYTDVN